MDPLVTSIVMRSIERLVVVLGGCLAIYCGYKLFLEMPSKEKGTGKLELPGGVSIHVSRVGPGVFFSLFGAVVLALSFQFGISVKQAGSGTDVAQGPVGETSYTGIGKTGGQKGKEEVIAMLVTIERLNKAAVSLAPGLDTFTRGDIERALRRAKVELMMSVWDKKQWGEFGDFRAWLDSGESNPPPASIAGAVKAFRAGASKPN